ncbi:MAG: hypothetical protein GYA15_02950 [Leptolinea sp.]|nr:hypothetical protein [Leptolinea sp.]
MYDRIASKAGGTDWQSLQTSRFFPGSPHIGQNGCVIGAVDRPQTSHQRIPVFPHPGHCGGKTQSMAFHAINST